MMNTFEEMNAAECQPTEITSISIPTGVATLLTHLDYVIQTSWQAYIGPASSDEIRSPPISYN